MEGGDTNSRMRLARRSRKSVAQTCSLSVSPGIVAARDDFLTTDGHGLTRMKTRLSLIRVYPCSSVVGSFWLRLGRAGLYRRVALLPNAAKLRRVGPIRRGADYKSAIRRDTAD